ncbi:MAG: hypothetical protein L3J43_00180 [Sulfurovum sp.]|nr:hypothetical protein [Sulfurovum sp.]
MKRYAFILSLLLMNLTHAQVAPENILLQKCLFTYTTHYKYLKGDKAFAYARVALGEEDTCTWAHKATSPKDAKSIALKVCKQENINAECKIVDLNNKWLVQEGDFSTVIPPDNTPLPSENIKQLKTKAKTIVLGECLSLFNTHLQDKGHKVFAYSVDEDGAFTCGVSREQQTLRQAAIIANKICEKQKISMNTKAPKHPCLSLSDGKKILVSAKDYNITLHQKTNKLLTTPSYNTYISKANKHFSGSCLTQYKYFLRIKDHKAFYFAKSTAGKVVCSYSFNQFTINAAKKSARKKCETAAKFKKITQKCQLYSLDLLTTEELKSKRMIK